MATPLTAVNHLKMMAQKIKTYVSELLADALSTTAEAIDEVEAKIPSVVYAECSSAASAVTKEAKLSRGGNWKKEPGALVVVQFTSTNTAQYPKLAVGNTGGESIVYGNSVITTSNLAFAGTANTYITYMYNGTNYVYVGKSTDSNTTYKAFTGASSSAAGAAGLVPAPTTSDPAKYLKGDGTWSTPPDTKYTHPTSSGNKHIPAGGQSGQILRWKADGEATWGADSNTTYKTFTGASSSAAGAAGLVPAPTISDPAKYLKDDGTWSTPPDTKYTHPTSSGNKHIPAGGQSGQILRWKADGEATWGNDNNTTYSEFKGATTTSQGETGLVPMPTSGDLNRYLCADGNWKAPTVTRYDQTAVEAMPTYSMAFSSNGMLLGRSSNKQLGGGNMGYADATVIYIPRDVTQVQAGAMSSCTKLTDIYINQAEAGQHVIFQSGSLPSSIEKTVKFHYNDHDEFANFNPFDVIFGSIIALKSKMGVSDTPIEGPEIFADTIAEKEVNSNEGRNKEMAQSGGGESD